MAIIILIQSLCCTYSVLGACSTLTNTKVSISMWKHSLVPSPYFSCFAQGWKARASSYAGKIGTGDEANGSSA